MQPSRYRRAGPAFDRDKLISLVRMALSSFAFSDEQTIARIAHSDDRPPVHDLIYHRLAPDVHMHLLTAMGWCSTALTQVSALQSQGRCRCRRNG